MLPEIEALLVIQDRDHKIQLAQQSLDNVPRDAAALKKRLDDAKENVEQAKAAVRANEIAINQIDIDRKIRKDTISKLETQQFETKKNDEYAALGAEVARYQAMVDELETQELEYMEKSDSLQQAYTDAKENLEKIKAEIASEIKALGERKVQDTARLKELTAERAELASKQDAELMRLYDRIFAKKGNKSVSPLNGNQCGGCHMKLISETISKTIEEKQLTQCENCACFLYSV